MKKKLILKLMLILIFPFILTSCGEKSKGVKLNIIEVEEYLLGEWSDSSCYINFYKDKSFSLQINSSYNSDVSELKGEYEVVSSKSIIFYIQEGRYKGETVYPKQLSAGLKILELNPLKKELYVKGYINNDEFLIARIVKK